MIKDNFKIELLAPAKNKECAFVAINAGADAVYIGADDFGARKKAGNSLEDLKDIVNYAHKFLVKVYVTINTIIFDNELPKVEKLVWDLYKIGVDAIIFQDFAFFEMNLPPIALHASTQCNNDSLDKIKFLKLMNVERVVLPREFSLKEIKEVTQNIDIETEVFVHGALCVSYSGQCYLSNYIGGRSANRGECAQPCRKKYSLVDDKDNVILKPQYLLSMMDNNLSAHLKDLIEAGVTSLKIEGRLKDKEYVTNVVSYYRNLIDTVSMDLQPSIGKVFTSFVPDITKTFNRGYTNFYFDGQRKTFINPKTPKFYGEKAAKVLAVNDKMLKLDTNIKLNVSDKIAYFDKNGNLTGTTVTKTIGNSIEVLNVGKISKNTILYRNYDSEFFNKLQQADFIRKIPVTISVNNKYIEFESFGNNKIVYEYTENFPVAQNIDKAKQNVEKQLSKLGDTEFILSKITINDDFNLFIPVSKLNEIRRNAVKMLQEKSAQNYVVTKREFPKVVNNYPCKTLDYSFNISNKLSKAFYEKCGCKVEEFSPECGECNNKVILMTTKHCLRDFAGLCLKKNPDNKKMYLLDEYGTKFPLKFDCKKCSMKIEEP